jgi:hypothetical protein
MRLGQATFRYGRFIPGTSLPGPPGFVGHSGVRMPRSSHRPLARLSVPATRHLVPYRVWAKYSIVFKLLLSDIIFRILVRKHPLGKLLSHPAFSVCRVPFLMAAAGVLAVAAAMSLQAAYRRLVRPPVSSV